MLRVVLLAAALFVGCSGATTAQESAEAQIRAALAQWTQDFNAGRADVICDLFARDLIATFRGAAERGYERQCTMLRTALADRGARSHNALEIREIIVSGDLAAARVVWTQTVRDLATGKETRSVEPGLDLFRREGDGRWRIFRYLAYEDTP